jgi:hypothetical protein
MNILSATLATVSSFFARKLDTPRRELAERAAENVFLGRRDLRGRTEPRTHIAEVPTPALGGNPVRSPRLRLGNRTGLVCWRAKP